jgi:hypothetical protein
MFRRPSRFSLLPNCRRYHVYKQYFRPTIEVIDYVPYNPSLPKISLTTEESFVLLENIRKVHAIYESDNQISNITEDVHIQSQNPFKEWYKE